MKWKSITRENRPALTFDLLYKYGCGLKHIY